MASISFGISSMDFGGFCDAIDVVTLSRRRVLDGTCTIHSPLVGVATYAVIASFKRKARLARHPHCAFEVRSSISRINGVGLILCSHSPHEFGRHVDVPAFASPSDVSITPRWICPITGAPAPDEPTTVLVRPAGHACLSSSDHSPGSPAFSLRTRRPRSPCQASVVPREAGNSRVSAAWPLRLPLPSAA